MPLYEYRCRQCATLFEARREASQADADVRCPAGHTDTVRMLSVFGTVGRAGSPAQRPKAPCAAHCTCHRFGAVVGSPGANN